MKLPNIEITHIVPPEVGWPVVIHCRKCKRTEIFLNVYALKPENGDYFQFDSMCVNENEGIALRHNMQATRERWPF